MNEGLRVLVILVLSLLSSLGSQSIFDTDMAAVKTPTFLSSTGNSSHGHHHPAGGVMGRKARVRHKRAILQLANMMRCITGCDPFMYKGYGCYCGYLGAGSPVDNIDKCCLEHDWCYTYAPCPPLLLYFLPYRWNCLAPGSATCAYSPYLRMSAKCSVQLCECDRAFSECISKYPCPSVKPLCKSSPIISIHNVLIGKR